MTKPTEQDLFDKAYNGIIKQGDLAFDHMNGNCFYYTSGGSKCNIGQVLDDLGAKKLEGWLISAEKLSKKEGYTWLADYDGRFLNDLQQAHDHSAEGNTIDARMNNYKKKMRAVAEYYNLRPPNADTDNTAD